MLTIWGDRISGNCLKVLWTARRLDLPHRWVDVDILRGETRTPEFLSRNPAGQVPVVEVEPGRYLAQSNAIIWYLADGSDLVPRDAYGRAKVMEWLFWEQYSHEPYIAVCRFHKVYLGRSDAELDPDRVARGNAALDHMERRLADREWLVEERPSLADVALLAYTRVAHEGGFELDSRPRVRAWVQRAEAALDVSPT